MKKITIILSFLLACVCLNNSFGQKKFELADVTKLTGMSDPQISPNAKNIVLVVSRPDLDKNRYNSELVLIDIATGKQTILTHERLSVSQPRWSPDGEQLSFLTRAGVGKEATNQIFVLSMNGGEAKQLTKAPKGVQHYSWNPDATAIAYVTEDEPANKAEIEKGHIVFEVGNNDMFINSKPNPSHIWLIKTESNEQKRLTSGEWSLPVTIPPGVPSSPLSWSADSKYIAFVKVINSYSGDGQYRTMQLLNVSDGSVKQLTSRSQFESYPLFSPDGSTLSYWYKKDAKNGNINQIWTTNKDGGEGKNIAAKLDRDLYRTIWMPDGKSLLVGGHDDNKTSLWIQNVDGNASKIDVGNISPAWGFWIEASVGKNGSIAFVGSETSQPSELYYLPNAKAKPIRLTDFNKEVKAMTMGKTETIYWENEGFNHCGIVTYPTNYEKGKKYPLVLVVHGGPNAASVETFSRFSQLLANQGYFVFEPNYRGSDNLGSAYKIAITEDAGAGPGRDVMAGLAKLKATDMIDVNNIAVSGWSYGGYMTVWLAGHYGGWKAAVAGAAVTDWLDQYNLGDSNVARGAALGGSPWKSSNIMQKYIDQSPITEAKNIKAPTLILANTGDPRVPISQSYKLFHTLKDNGVETKFFAWNIPAHNASDPVSQMDRDRLWISWLNQYLKGSKQ